MKEFNVESIFPYQPICFEETLCSNYCRISADSPLYGYVWHMYEFNNVLGTSPFLVLPDCCYDLLFACSKGHFRIYVHGGTNSFTGTNDLDDCDILFGISLLPGALSLITNRSAEDFADKLVRITENVLLESEDFIQNMTGSESFEERLLLVNQYIEKTIGMTHSKEYIRFLECCNELLYTNNVGIAADQLGYSSRHFYRIFKYYTGFSPKEYKEKLRIQQSFKLLINHSGKGIRDIAWQSGYYDASHMNKAYINAMGYSPSDLYKLFRENAATLGIVL